MDSVYYSLASKSNFNKALNHFFKVTEVVDDIENKSNLGDIINQQINEGEILHDQILPIVGAVIRDKFQYSYDSFNIPVLVNDFTKLADETGKWTALDIVMVYYTPNGDVVVINPKNPVSWASVRELARDQMLVIYVKYRKEVNTKLEMEAIAAIEEMISGKDVFINKDFIDQTIVQKVAQKAVVQAAQDASNKKMTPKYAVRVSNELFHNGNVEAWKKIIESYMTKYPNFQVNIFFEGELINNINSLFKWGKVKHGDSIFFQVIGVDIKGVSKLQKYLYEGASPRYEQFLKIDVGKVLNLF